VLPAGQSLNKEGQWLISDLLPLLVHHALAAARHQRQQHRQTSSNRSQFSSFSFVTHHSASYEQAFPTGRPSFKRALSITRCILANQQFPHWNE